MILQKCPCIDLFEQHLKLYSLKEALGGYVFIY